MDDLAPFTYLLIFAVLALLNYAMQRIAKWLRQQQAQETAKATPPPKAQQPVEKLKPPRGQAERVAARQLEQLPPGTREDRLRRARKLLEEPLEVREARARTQRTRAVAVQSPRKHAVPRVRPLLQDRQSLRQAIVIMTVLGPCRAQQPPDMR